MTIYVVKTCEILFDRHIEVFQSSILHLCYIVLNCIPYLEMAKSGVFERDANFTRLKGILANEAARL